MPVKKNYNDILDEINQKLEDINNISKDDILKIKQTIDTIETTMLDPQAETSLQNIKEKLDTISAQIDDCNIKLIENLSKEISELQTNTVNINQQLENMQNIQNLALTRAEFEEFEKQQLDLAIKTNESVYTDLSLIKETTNSIANYDVSKISDVLKIDVALDNLHNNLTTYIHKLFNEVPNQLPSISEIGSIVKDFNEIQQKSIKQTQQLIQDVSNHLDMFENKTFASQLLKLADIYENLNVIKNWTNEVGSINQAIENVYARFGDTVDFDDLTDKVDIIYQNVGILNDWANKLDHVNSKISDVQSSFGTLNSCLSEIQNINEIVLSFKERFFDDFDVEDVTNKLDIIYENLTSLSVWVNKIDTIQSGIDKINEQSEEQQFIIDKVDIIYESINGLNTWLSKIDNISQTSNKLDEMMNDIKDILDKSNNNIEKIISNDCDVKTSLENIANELNIITSTTKNDTDNYVYTLLDIEADFLKLHKFLSDNTKETSNDITSIKDQFEILNEDISSISKRTNKLILTADDANKEFKKHLQTFKDEIEYLQNQNREFDPNYKFASIDKKIEAMHLKTMQSLEATGNIQNAFAYLAEWIDEAGTTFNNIISSLENIDDKNSDIKIMLNNVIDNKNNDIKTMLNKIIENNNELEEIKNQLNNLQEEFDAVKAGQNDVCDDIKKQMVQLINVISTLELPEFDISNLQPFMDKIETISDNKTQQLEHIISVLEKENQEHKEKISSLEDKLNEYETKFTNIENLLIKLNTNTENINNNPKTEYTDIIENKFNSINDTLNNLGSIVNTLSISLSEQFQNNKSNEQYIEVNNKINNLEIALNTLNNNILALKDNNSDEKLSEISGKLNSFDSNIDKIVKYIEED